MTQNPGIGSLQIVKSLQENLENRRSAINDQAQPRVYLSRSEFWNQHQHQYLHQHQHLHQHQYQHQRQHLHQRKHLHRQIFNDFNRKITLPTEFPVDEEKSNIIDVEGTFYTLVNSLQQRRLLIR